MKKILIVSFLMLSLMGFSQSETNIEEQENEILKNTVRVRIDPNIINLGSGEALPPVDTTGINETPEPPEPPDPNLRRLIFFIHGLGGTDESWLKTAEAIQNPFKTGQNFTARLCSSVRIDYSNNVYDLFTAADAVKLQISQASSNLLYNAGGPNSGYDPNTLRNFVIAHSQGGLVSRTMLYKDFVNLNAVNSLPLFGYGGLVTVASPLQGARIINNKDALYDLSLTACKKLSKPFLLQSASNPLIVNTILNILGKEKLDNFCNLSVFSAMPELMKDIDGPIINDYKVGAPFINTLNSSVSLPGYNEMYKIAFYGVEPNQNLMWRTMNWFIKSPNMANTWEANDDYEFLQTMIIPSTLNFLASSVSYKQNALNAFNSFQNLAAMSAICHTMIPVALYYFLMYSQYENISQAYKEGYEWFEDAPGRWEAIIGSREYVRDVNSYFTCNCAGPLLSKKTGIVNNPNDCQAFCYPYQVENIVGPTHTYVLYIKDSDGVALAESAKNLPGATHIPIKLEGVQLSLTVFTGSSHMQIRNDEAMREKLTNLLNGQYGFYFETYPQ